LTITVYYCVLLLHYCV